MLLNHPPQYLVFLPSGGKVGQRVLLTFQSLPCEVPENDEENVVTPTTASLTRKSAGF